MLISFSVYLTNRGSSELVKDKGLHLLCYSKALFFFGSLILPLPHPDLLFNPWDLNRSISLVDPQELQQLQGLEIFLFSGAFQQQFHVYPLWMGSIRRRKQESSLPNDVTDRTACQSEAILTSPPTVEWEHDRHEELYKFPHGIRPHS